MNFKEISVPKTYKMEKEVFDIRKMNEELQKLKKDFEKLKEDLEFGWREELKKETKIWDKLSDEALENFENSNDSSE